MENQLNTAIDKAEIKKIADKILHDNRSKLSILEKREFEKAVQKIIEGSSLKEAAGLTKEKEDFLYNKAYTLYQSGKFKQAMVLFTFLYNFDKECYRYIFAIAGCQQHLEDYDAAGGNYALCSNLEPENPVPHFHRYDCFMKVNNPWAALFSLLTCIELCKIDKDYSVLLARAELEIKNVKEILKKWCEQNDVPKVEK